LSRRSSPVNPTRRPNCSGRTPSFKDSASLTSSPRSPGCETATRGDALSQTRLEGDNLWRKKGVTDAEEGGRPKRCRRASSVDPARWSRRRLEGNRPAQRREQRRCRRPRGDSSSRELGCCSRCRSSTPGRCRCLAQPTCKWASLSHNFHLWCTARSSRSEHSAPVFRRRASPRCIPSVGLRRWRSRDDSRSASRCRWAALYRR